MLGAATDVNVFERTIINEGADHFLGDLETIRDLLDREESVR
jgi:hypothetical protein